MFICGLAEREFNWFSFYRIWLPSFRRVFIGERAKFIRPQLVLLIYILLGLDIILISSLCSLFLWILGLILVGLENPSFLF